MQLFNSLGRKKEVFVPADPAHVSMYVCGITAYDYCHVGHARSAVVFDVLARLLRSKGYKLTFIRNFTDIDDKIINRANEVGVPWYEISQKFIQAFHEDMDLLGVQRADVEPLCTTHIPEMLALTQELVNNGSAYRTLTGDVYFRVRAYEPYGKLSGRDLDDLRAGARIMSGEGKEDPLDFALWKAAKPGEPTWDSPWGPGRPGWHLECSAMAARYAPLPLDIHGGGQDLVFPHHENEIAQTGASTGQLLARFWVHNGFVQINKEKMSKSLGNFFTIREILASFIPEVLRFFLISQHYRGPLDFSFEGLEEAEKALRRIYTAMAAMQEAVAREKKTRTPLPQPLLDELTAAEQGFESAMDDDLNTAGALGHVFGAVRLAGRMLEDKAIARSEAAAEAYARILSDLARWGELLGVFAQSPADFLTQLRQSRAQRSGVSIPIVEELLARRAVARAAKDFAASDSIRAELSGLGVEVKDTPGGQTWDIA